MACGFGCVGLVAFLGTCVLILAPDPESFEQTTQNELPTIVIDPGHGGKDEGAKARGLKEKDVTLQIALALEAKLRERSFPVVLTRSDDRFVSLAERVEIANHIPKGVPLFISIHLNVDRQSATDGVETFYATQKNTTTDWGWIGFFSCSNASIPEDPGDALAGSIQTAIVQHLETRSRGIKARSLYVVRNTRGPAVLVEVGFMSNPVEAHLLRQGFYRERVAAAIAEGILLSLPKEVRQRLTLNKPEPVQTIITP